MDTKIISLKILLYPFAASTAQSLAKVVTCENRYQIGVQKLYLIKIQLIIKTWLYLFAEITFADFPYSQAPR